MDLLDLDSDLIEALSVAHSCLPGLGLDLACEKGSPDVVYRSPSVTCGFAASVSVCLRISRSEEKPRPIILLLPTSVISEYLLVAETGIVVCLSSEVVACGLVGPVCSSASVTIVVGCRIGYAGFLQRIQLFTTAAFKTAIVSELVNYVGTFHICAHHVYVQACTGHNTVPGPVAPTICRGGT